ncbi:MAG TPA: 3-dehydroquinate synthase family protein [Burkholderiales bacterium]|nr:3-dehydroquinate synthase family protein [Burkholderiales bacterium]
MSASFEIASHIKNYRVTIGDDLLAGCASDIEDHIFLCDRFFTARLSSVYRRVISIDATEKSKSLDQMSDVIIRLREAGATRKTVLIAVGGGVIQDIATFCASLYMRGIPWLYLPSTLLGMVDSCIGGKSAINVGPYKNIVGNYYPPEAVLIDPVLTKSLGAEQKVAGLCEAAKICYARGSDSFKRYMALEPGLDIDGLELETLIELSLQSKKWFIETDEFDQNERLLLNFGHTFGHAIEGATDFRIGHGVAVGVGILAAVYHARMVYGSERIAEQTVMLERHIRFLLASIPALREILALADPETLFDRFASDKKHTVSAYTIIGLTKEGALRLFRLPRGAESDAAIRRIFAAIVQPSFFDDIPSAHL